MSLYKNTTQVPNELFDVLLKTLSSSEHKVLLFIIRRTIGIRDPDSPTGRLERAWISQWLFCRACSLSGRAVSSAIDTLVKKSLIEVSDIAGHVLKTKSKRRGISRLYFASRLRLEVKPSSKVSEAACQKPVTFSHTIKLKQIKLSCYNSSQGGQRISDVQRFKQIQENRHSTNKKDTP